MGDGPLTKHKEDIYTNMEVRVENVPEDLKSYKQWVAWKSLECEGKVKKLPMNPTDGSPADVGNPDTWGTFEEALEFCRESRRASGIGFVFTKQDPFIGIDLDKCRDPETGLWAPQIQDIVARIESYTEVSPSGNGLHIIARGNLQGASKRGQGLEIYDKSRFFTMTGNRFQSAPPDIIERSEEICGLLIEKFGNPVDACKTGNGLEDQDRKLLEKAFGSKKGSEIKKLWNGITSGYASQSEADLGFCQHLAFWLGRDLSRIDRVFRASGLYRSKWDEIHDGGHKSYGLMTIEKAIDSGHDVYVGRSENGEPDSFEFNLTDMGNANRLVHHFGKDIRYCKAWSKWLIWDGRRWAEDRTDKIFQYAKKTVLFVYDEISRISDSTERKKITRHAQFSESEARIRAMVSLARSDERVAVVPEALDTHSWLLNCLNGTVDLKTGNLMAHDRRHLFTQLAPVEYDRHADCPLWKSFLAKIMDGNEEMIGFLKRAIGYGLTGDTREQCFFIFHGSGSNGKSTFLQTVHLVLGDYSKQTPTETLLVKPKGSIPNDIARLRGARFVVASEAEDKQRLAESQIKQMTGGDTITARFMRQEWFDFIPICKIFLGTNHKPVIRGTDHAIWRRIRLVPFAVTIDNPDETFPEKLKEELPGILAWAVAGCLEWQARKLGIPPEVKKATDVYRSEMDVISDFINDFCVVEPTAWVLVADLYEAYCRWCDRNGERALAKRALGQMLSARGFGSDKNHLGWYRMGIGLLQA